MPEMPEVQSIINSLLENNITNHKIVDVEIIMSKILKNCDEKTFKNYLINEKIISISRKGKYLIFHLTNNKIFVNHLRMEGKLYLENNDVNMDKKHILINIFFDNNQKLIYHDTRRFGTFTIYNKNNYLISKELSKLGLDPLEEGYNYLYLKNKVADSKRHIKTLLLDQRIVSGIGNIYADEILFMSKISPLRLAKDIKDEEWEQIVISSKIIMKKAIENKGTTISTYYYKKEKIGGFQEFLQVHTKKSLPCVVCNNLITKIKVNGRGTYLCKNCQK